MNLIYSVNELICNLKFFFKVIILSFTDYTLASSQHSYSKLLKAAEKNGFSLYSYDVGNIVASGF